MTFSKDITRFVEKTGIRASVVLRKLGLDAFRGVALRSPVDKGRYRGSHRISVNSVDDSVESERESSIGPPRFGDAAQTVDFAVFGDSIHITNNLPYARRIEKGWSKQAPAGVYSLTFQELKSGFARTVRSLQ